MAAKKTSSERITPNNVSKVAPTKTKKEAKVVTKAKSLTLKEMARELSNGGLVKIDLMIPDGSGGIDLTKKMRVLYEQEPVRYAIPLDFKEREGATQVVVWNFIRFTYPKAVMVKMPESIFEILKDSLHIKDADLLADSSEAKIKALS